MANLRYLTKIALAITLLCLVAVNAWAGNTTLYDGTAPTPPTAKQKMWALAATALLNEVNKKNHTTLAGMELTPGNINRQQQLLQAWWGIHDRQDLLEKLAWVQLSGHRVGFEKLGRAVTMMNDQEYQTLLQESSEDIEAYNAITIAKAYYEKLGTDSLIAWDYCRYISLCRWGYAVGYLSEKEAWAKIMPAARILQSTYTSWPELGENFIIGHKYWSYAETQESLPRFQQALATLTTSTQSPWKTIPWTTSLKP